MTYPQGERGRIAALLILFLIIVFLIELIIAPTWSRYRTLITDNQSLQLHYDKYSQIAGQLPNLKEQQLLNKNSVINEVLITGESRALAAANLQRLIQTAVQRHQGKVLSTRVLKHRQQDVFEEIPLNVRVQISIEGLQKVVHYIENTKPALFIEKLDITPTRNRRDKQNKQLNARIELFALSATFVSGEANE